MQDQFASPLEHVNFGRVSEMSNQEEDVFGRNFEHGEGRHDAPNRGQDQGCSRL